MCKVLLIGSNGMLGQALKKRLESDGYNLYCVNRSNSDYCFELSDDKSLKNCFFEVKPDIVINAAAITDLNLCERDPGNAYLINGRAPGVLSDVCSAFGAYFIQISTDHYYCGDGKTLHDELTPIRMLNEYARAKYIGEQLTSLYKNALVLRTNIVGFRGRTQPTFLEWAISELTCHRRMTLFSDFYTSSMHTADFARVLSDLIPMHPTGLYNLASSEVSSKMEFILGLSREIFGTEPNYAEGSVRDISGAPRGDSLGLDTHKIEELLGYKMPGLKATLSSIKKEYNERKTHEEL